MNEYAMADYTRNILFDCESIVNLNSAQYYELLGC
jgi:hypothetical protein